MQRNVSNNKTKSDRTKVVVTVVILIILAILIFLVPAYQYAYKKRCVSYINNNFPDFNIYSVKYVSSEVFSDLFTSYPAHAHCDLVITKKTNDRIRFELAYKAGDNPTYKSNEGYSVLNLYSKRYNDFNFSELIKDNLALIILGEKKDNYHDTREIYQVYKEIEELQFNWYYVAMITDLKNNTNRQKEKYFRVNNSAVYYLESSDWVPVAKAIDYQNYESIYQP